MAKTTRIGWTNHTFNMVTGCAKVSPGCKHCYAERDRFARPFWGERAERQTRSDAYWREPFKWNDKASKAGVPELVFAGSYCDVFEDHETVVHELGRLWDLIEQTPWLRWQLLTKRSGRIKDSLPRAWGSMAYHNVWLGVSCENQAYADERIEGLCFVGGNVRFASLEPLLGPIDISYYLKWGCVTWVIIGGESGPNHRPMQEEWALDIQAQCARYGVPSFYKQDGGPKSGTIAHPRKWRQEFPRML